MVFCNQPWPCALNTINECKNGPGSIYRRRHTLCVYVPCHFLFLFFLSCLLLGVFCILYCVRSIGYFGFRLLCPIFFNKPLLLQLKINFILPVLYSIGLHFLDALWISCTFNRLGVLGHWGTSTGLHASAQWGSYIKRTKKYNFLYRSFRWGSEAAIHIPSNVRVACTACHAAKLYTTVHWPRKSSATCWQAWLCFGCLFGSSMHTLWKMHSGRTPLTWLKFNLRPQTVAYACKTKHWVHHLR